MIQKATKIKMLLIKLAEIAEKLATPEGCDKKEFASAVVAFRDATEMTPNQFAQYFGVSVQSLYRWEKNGVSYHRVTKKICQIFKRKLTDEEEPKEKLVEVSPEDLVKVTLTFEISAGYITNFFNGLLKQNQK